MGENISTCPILLKNFGKNACNSLAHWDVNPRF